MFIPLLFKKFYSHKLEKSDNTVVRATRAWKMENFHENLLFQFLHISQDRDDKVDLGI